MSNISACVLMGLSHGAIDWSFIWYRGISGNICSFYYNTMASMPIIDLKIYLERYDPQLSFTVTQVQSR